MRPMKEKTRQYLEEQNLIGDGSYNYEIEVEGSDLYKDPKNFVYTDLVGSTGGADIPHDIHGGGNYIFRDDGMIITTYTKGTKVMLSIVDSEDKLLSIDRYAGATEFPIFDLGEKYSSGPNMNTLLFKTEDGRILLFINDHGVRSGTNRVAQVLCYESENRKGTDFEYKSTVYKYEVGDEQKSFEPQRTTIGMPLELSTGRILIPLFVSDVWKDYPDYTEERVKIAISDDEGDTWRDHQTWNNWWMNPTKGMCVFEIPEEYGEDAQRQVLMTTSTYYASGEIYTAVSMDDGETFTYKKWDKPGIGIPQQTFYMSGNDGYNYMLHNPTIHAYYDVYKRPANKPLLEHQLTGTDGWEKIEINTRLGDDGYDRAFISDSGTFMTVGTSYFGGHSAGYLMGSKRAPYDGVIQPKSLSLSRQRGSAGTLTIDVDNKDGIANPYSDINDDKGLLTTNRRIKLKQGYGDDLVTTFTGLIDDISMTTYPQKLTIGLRDMMKLALDQTISVRSNQSTIIFKNQRIEDIFKYLCSIAGLKVDRVDYSGITLSEVEFSQESYGDAFQKLADLVSFEYGADEYGAMYFVRDYQPKNPDIAFVFQEGKNITQLGYDISDNDLYNRVEVYGKTGDEGSENVLRVSKRFPEVNEYNIPFQKVMRIDATENDTQAQLELIADRAIYLMQSKAKVVKFASIGIPWLQIGDFIQVIETSTTTNNAYRITDISTTMDDEKYTMNITAYYYGGSVYTDGLYPTDPDIEPDIT